jgi:hypothetical protein
MKPETDSVDDAVVRTLVAHIVDVPVAQKTPLPVALHAMGFCAAILLRELLDAPASTPSRTSCAASNASEPTRTLMN